MPTVNEQQIEADPAVSTRMAYYQQFSGMHEAYSWWCGQHGHQVYSPASIAAYLDSRDADADLLGICSAITAAFDPVASDVVYEVLERRLKIQPPFGWNKSDRLAFAELDPVTRAAVTRREDERERNLNRAKNKFNLKLQSLKVWGSNVEGIYE